MSRRKFLKQIGVLAGAATTVPALSAIHKEGKKMPMKIGVLVPQNKSVIGLGDSFVNGLRLFQEKHKEKWTEDVEFIVESYTLSSSSIIGKSQKLIFENMVDMVVAHTSTLFLSTIRDLYHDNEKFLLVSDIGAKVGNYIPTSPFIYTNSLNLWQSSYAMGNWAGKNLGKTSVIVSSFYDSGFDNTGMFYKGFEEAGGENKGFLMLDPPNASVNPKALINQIETINSELIFANFSGSDAVIFANAFLNSHLNGKIPMVANPFMLDEQLQHRINGNMDGVKSAFSWTPEMNHAANKEFIKDATAKYGKEPGVFELLGYECAMILDSAIKHNGNNANKEDFSKAMADVKINGPRGIVKMDRQSHFTNADICLRSMTKDGFNFVNKPIADQLAYVSEDDDGVRKDFSGLISGWQNPYLTE